MILGELTFGAPLLRVQCFTSEVLGSPRCDCNEQMEIALKSIAAEGRGLVIFVHQEGRGIGLMAKLQAYALQDAGHDAVEANGALGFRAACRDYSLPAEILHELGVTQVRLLSNNPHKSRALAAAGIDVVARISCEAASQPHSFAYLRTRKESMGHALSLGDGERMEAESSETQPRLSHRSEHAVTERSAGPVVNLCKTFGDSEAKGRRTMRAPK